MKKARFNKLIRFSSAAVLVVMIITGHSVVQGFSNINSTNKWAWNDVVGWIDFYVGNTGLNVKSTKVDRWGDIYTSSEAYIATHCTSLPPDSINDCTPTFGVSNDGSGNLSSYAWSDEYGWISFKGSTPDYGVTIDGSGDFNGFAWNDIIGWISFNCLSTSPDHCGGGSTSYKVNTTWNSTAPPGTTDNYLESVTIDTESDDGFIINSIYWEGTKPADATIGFQLAVATSTDFTGIDFLGEDGTVSTLYAVGDLDADGIESVPINSSYHNPFEAGYRYFRYRVYLDKATASPVVSKVVVNWSR
ncbi:MAG: hypothetical protein WD883_03075 [Candidatus Colwellbacteria bacterium]